MIAAADKQKLRALLRDVDQSLKRLLAPSAEKAELLVAHLTQGNPDLVRAPRGLADAVRKLRKAGLSDAQIRAGAKRLIAELAKTHGGRETVV